MAVTPRRARATDPSTSHEYLAKLLDDTGLYLQVLKVAARSADHGDKGWSDDWLARQLAHPRNIVARVRLEVERDGWLVRLPAVARPDGQRVLVFKLKPELRGLIDMTAAVEKET